MNGRWRLFAAALRTITGGPYSPVAAIRFVPLAGIVLGVAAAAIYWLASQVWPSSIAVVLAMLATSAVTAPAERAAGPGNALQPVFFVLIKYNTLMALSAAKLPFVLPEHLTLGLIMVAGQAASRALVVSRMATDPTAATRVTTADLIIALVQGAVPGLVLGIPGLIGLAAALGIRLAQGAIRPDRPDRPAKAPDLSTALPARLEFTQQLTEITFYLGALAAWRYV